MKAPSLRRTILASLFLGVFAGAALAQIPVPPPPPLPGLDIRITTGHPPALRREVRPPIPGAGYIWVGGFWSSDGGHWAWVPGRWELPPESEAYWIGPRYVRGSGGYIYEPGHWSNQRLVAGEDVRRHRAWRSHEREHEKELERERNREYYRERER